MPGSTDRACEDLFEDSVDGDRIRQSKGQNSYLGATINSRTETDGNLRGS